MNIDEGQSPAPMEERWSLLARVYNILNQEGIPVFLTCGTLLGAMRENDFIEWDGDIDLACYDVRQILRLRKEFAIVNLRVDFRDYNTKHRSPVLMIRDINCTTSYHLDIFQFEKTDEGIVYKYTIKTPFQSFLVDALSKVFSMKSGEQAHVIQFFDQSDDVSLSRKVLELVNLALSKQGVHIFNTFKMIPYNFKGIKVYIPSKPIEHLRLLYGEKWRVPIKRYRNCEIRTQNQRKVRL